jgi:N-acetylmuramoyl-L-alanine amidase
MKKIGFSSKKKNINYNFTLHKKYISFFITVFALLFVCYIFCSSSTAHLPFFITNNSNHPSTSNNDNNSNNTNSNNNADSNTNNSSNNDNNTSTNDSSRNSSAFSQITITIDPGHGGFDPGKVGNDGTKEKDINLQISLYLREQLQDMGFTVYMTRETDTSLETEGASSKKNSDLNNRVHITEEYSSDLLISIHQNSFSQENVHGAQVFYYGSSEEGKLLAGYIQTSIKEQADKENTRDIKGNTEYLILAKSPCTALIVECGFLSNPDECTNLCNSEYQYKMAYAIACGVKNYFLLTENTGELSNR